MYFDMELKPAERPALQTDTGICITYGELREQIAEFRHAVRQRSFVFLLCENTPGAVIGYLGCLNAGAVPLLLNTELDEALLQEMYERYQPEYVWMPKKKAEAWKPCNLSEKQNNEDENINKNDEENCAITYEKAEYVLYQTEAPKCELHPGTGIAAGNLRKYRKSETGTSVTTESGKQRGIDYGVFEIDGVRTCDYLSANAVHLWIVRDEQSFSGGSLCASDDLQRGTAAILGLFQISGRNQSGGRSIHV